MFPVMTSMACRKPRVAEPVSGYCAKKAFICRTGRHGCVDIREGEEEEGRGLGEGEEEGRGWGGERDIRKQVVQSY